MWYVMSARKSKHIRLKCLNSRRTKRINYSKNKYDVNIKKLILIHWKMRKIEKKLKYVLWSTINLSRRLNLIKK